MNPYGPPPQQPYPQQPAQHPQQPPQQHYPQQPHYGNPYPPQPPKKSGMSGCLIAVLIFVACGVLGVVGIGFVIWREAGGLLGGMKDLAALMIEAQSAEGAEEVRDLGCTQALVIDTEKLEGILVTLEAEVAKKENRPAKPPDISKDGAYFVQCQVSSGTAPTCDQVAKTFAKAVSPKDKFLVSVQSNSGGSANCSMAYQKDGTQIGVASAPNIPK